VRPEFPFEGLVIGVLVFLGIGLPGLVIEPSVRTATMFGVFLVPVVVLVWLGFRRAEIVLDTEAGVLRVVRHRPPFATTTREIQRASIVDVRIAHRPRARSVVLVLVSGEEVWLPGMSSAEHPAEPLAALVRDWM